MPSEERNGEFANREEATMEPSFDALAKGLANGTVSRGKALRLMGAALAGGALASIPGVAWAAKPSCPSGVTCKGQCCPVGATCGKGKGGGCTCPTGQTACGGQCIALNTDQNCGTCGNACSGGKTCQGGVCACPTGQTECGGVCRDLATDVANCGVCGTACGTEQSCINGRCQCLPGFEFCVDKCCPTGTECVALPGGGTRCANYCPSGVTATPGCNSVFTNGCVCSQSGPNTRERCCIGDGPSAGTDMCCPRDTSCCWRVTFNSATPTACCAAGTTCNTTTGTCV